MLAATWQENKLKVWVGDLIKGIVTIGSQDRKRPANRPLAYKIGVDNLLAFSVG